MPRDDDTPTRPLNTEDNVHPWNRGMRQQVQGIPPGAVPQMYLEPMPLPADIEKEAIAQRAITFFLLSLRSHTARERALVSAVEAVMEHDPDNRPAADRKVLIVAAGSLGGSAPAEQQPEE